MRYSLRSWFGVWLMGLLLLSGCATNRDPSGLERRSPSARTTDRESDEDWSSDAVENRVEAHARYATAIVHDLNDRPAEAVEQYYKAASLDFGNEPLVLDVSRRLLQLKEAKKALELLKKSTAQPGASGLLFTRLATVYTFLGETNQALQAAQTAIAKDPKNLLAYQQLAQIHAQKGEYREGLRVLQQAAEQADLTVPGLVDLAEACLSLRVVDKQDKEALRQLGKTMLVRAEASKTSDPILLQRMADGFMFLGMSEEASALYDRLLERFPHLPGLRERLIDIYIKQQDLEKATEQLESILLDHPTNLRAHYLLGSLAYENKDMEKAEGHFRKVILLHPDFEQAYYDLAGTQINLDKPQEAIDTLEAARSKFKLRFVLELYSALAFSRLKEYKQAVKHFEAAEIIARAGETNRLTHIFYFQIGAAYERNKQFTEAERYFQKCLEQEPDFSEALNYLGYMWAERGENLQEARGLIEKALKLEPENAAFLDSLGWVLFKLNQPQEALDYLLKAIAFAEEPDPVLFDHIGDVYAALNQAEKALEAWKKSLDLVPNEEIQKKLDAARSQNSPMP